MRVARLKANLVLLREQLSMSENPAMGAIAGLAAAIVGGIVWARVADTPIAMFGVGIMAVAAEILCGLAVRFFGKGVTLRFGAIGLLTTFLGCVLGNLLMVARIIAGEQHLGLFEVLAGLDYLLAFEVVRAFVTPVDSLFYAFGLYQGYRMSLRPLTEAEITLIAGSQPESPPEKTSGS